MQPVAFCTRCRGMKVGWNSRYARHRLICQQWISRTSKWLILAGLLAFLVLYPTPSVLVSSDLSPDQSVEEAAFDALPLAAPSPAVSAIAAFLEKYKVDTAHRKRIAEAIVASGRKYNVDPRLVASIMIVESRANPFAISTSDSIGIMQIHLPTWGHTADREGINLFKIEDNVDLGVRILRDYIQRHGLWDGVRRYKGWNSEDPLSTQSVEEYIQKIQRIYSPPQSS